MTRRRVALLLALVATVALATSTGAVSSMSAERPLQVEVADEGSAYIGFEQTASSTANGTTNLTVAVTNRFPPGTALTTVEVAVGGDARHLAADGPLDPGERVTVTFRSVACDDRIRIAAFGSGVSVRFERAVACS